MNYAQSFEEFSQSLQPMDLALYAGAGLIIWVLFKEQLNPLQKSILDSFIQIKNWLVNLKEQRVLKQQVTSYTNPKTDLVKVAVNKNDVFFQLISSWKTTRDLAVKAGCLEAVKQIDQIFPYLGPESCNQQTETHNE
jgi:hypothetical protein